MLQPDQKLGSYRIIRFLGAGAMGSVYEVKHAAMGTQHAMKVLADQYLRNSAVRERFKREAQLMFSLGAHPHIVRATDLLETDEVLGLVIDLVEGGDLGQALERRPGPLPWADVAAVMRPVISAVAYAHEKRVVHRDLKPDNVLLRPNGTWAGVPLVTDFGIAKIIGSESATRTQSRMGTMCYGAPEQFKNAKEVGAEADVWALAMMTWRLVMGALPVDPDDNIALIKLYEGMEPVPPIRGVPEPIAHAISAALQVNANLRPRDASVLAKLFSAADGDRSPLATQRAAPSPPAATVVSRAVPAQPSAPAVAEKAQKPEKLEKPEPPRPSIPSAPRLATAPVTRLPTSPVKRNQTDPDDDLVVKLPNTGGGSLKWLIGGILGAALILALVMVSGARKAPPRGPPQQQATATPTQPAPPPPPPEPPRPDCPSLEAADASRTAGQAASARTAYHAACDTGCPRACVELAVMMHLGEGGAKDTDGAVEPARKHLPAVEAACEEGDAASCLVAGAANADAVGTGRSPVTAVARFRKACDLDLAPGCRALGLTLAEGRGVDKDEAAAVTSLDKACKAAFRDACEKLGDLLERQVVGVDDGRRADLLTHACDGGVVESCAELGLAYADGLGGLRRDASLAARLLERACDGKQPGTCAKLALMLEAAGASGHAKAVALQRDAGVIFIPAGSFGMGSALGETQREDDERPHDVTLTRGFWLHATEVTQGQYEALMGSNPSEFKACGPSCPVDSVSWQEAVAYMDRLSLRDGLEACYAGGRFKGPQCSGYRLPTEAEWEYAARAGSSEARHGDPEVIAWHDANAGKTPHPVATKQPNAWGLHDMLGNVWEWSHDWYGAYGAAARDPAGPGGGSSRVIRGGGWEVPSSSVRAAFRGGFGPAERGNFLGFRVARTAAFADRP
jgi:formylglycine-generating enzyme required for sulfatase activity/serine/threonine protein kinase